VPQFVHRPALSKLEGSTGTEHDVDRDYDDPKKDLCLSIRHDPQERKGERDLAPQSGQDSSEARGIPPEEHVVEVPGRDLRIVPSKPKRDAPCLHRTRCQECDLISFRQPQPLFVVQVLSTRVARRARAPRGPSPEGDTYVARDECVVVPPQLAHPPDLTEHPQSEEEAG